MIASTPLRPLAPHEIWRLAVDEEQSVARSSHLAMFDASFHLGRVIIGDGMSYAQAVDPHMLYATLDGTTRFSRGGIGRRDPIDRPDAPGALSPAPAGWERAVEINISLARGSTISKLRRGASRTDVLVAHRPSNAGSS